MELHPPVLVGGADILWAREYQGHYVAAGSLPAEQPMILVGKTRPGCE